MGNLCQGQLLHIGRLGLLDQDFEREWNEEMSIALVELWLELDPVQTKGVQERWKAFHQAKDADGQAGPEGKDGPKHNSTIPKHRKWFQFKLEVKSNCKANNLVL